MGWPKGTPRRTAQRKFAQGAYVPPALAAVPSTSTAQATTSRNKEPTATNDSRCLEMFLKPPSAKLLLDYVSYRSHSVLQPRVILERLREVNNEKEFRNKGLKKGRQVGTRKRISPSYRPLTMQLRTREQRWSCHKSVTPKVVNRAKRQQSNRTLRTKRVTSQQQKRVTSRQRRVMTPSIDASDQLEEDTAESQNYTAKSQNHIDESQEVTAELHEATAEFEEATTELEEATAESLDNTDQYELQYEKNQLQHNLNLLRDDTNQLLDDSNESRDGSERLHYDTDQEENKSIIECEETVIQGKTTTNQLLDGTTQLAEYSNDFSIYSIHLPQYFKEPPDYSIQQPDYSIQQPDYSIKLPDTTQLQDVTSEPLDDASQRQDYTYEIQEDTSPPNDVTSVPQDTSPPNDVEPAELDTSPPNDVESAELDTSPPNDVTSAEKDTSPPNDVASKPEEIDDSLLQIRYSRNIRLKLPKQYKTQPIAVKSQRKRVATQPNDVAPQQKRAKRVIKPKKTNNVPKKTNNVPKKKPRRRPMKKCTETFTTTGSEFSIDDNRPLKYFAKKSTPKSLMGPPRPRLPPMQSYDSCSDVSDVPIRGPTATAGPSSRMGRPIARLSYATGLRNGQPSQSFRPPASHFVQNETIGTMVRLPSDCSKRNFYGEQGIKLWMKSVQEKTNQELTQYPQITSVYSGSACVQYLQEHTNSLESSKRCPATEWKTLKQVIDTEKLNFDLRCKMCRQCKIIEKIMTLTTLLKRQKKIDCFEEEASCPPVRVADTSSPQSSNVKFIIIDLLPQHPHLMIKIKISNKNNTQNVNSCLIPRADSTISNEFILTENEELLQQIIIDLSLSCGDPPPASDSDDQDNPRDNSKPGYQANLGDYLKPPPADLNEDTGELLDAPVYYPSAEEFSDPIAYIEDIWDEVSIYGICKISPPPGFVPTCKADDDICFDVSNQYIARLYTRWGPATWKMSAIKASVQAQSVEYNRPLKLENVELNVPKLYDTVQRLGGLQTVFNENKWGLVADEMLLNSSPYSIRKLERLYTKYILPYDTLSLDERTYFLEEASSAWAEKQAKLLKHAQNPLEFQKRLLGESKTPEDDSNDRDQPHDAEDCVKPGVSMNLAQFKKIASTCFDNFFRNRAVNTKEIESNYWQTVINCTDHICVNSASIDTGELGLGFSKNRNDEYSSHPWNLKQISENPRNMLRSLGRALGVTVPTLHLGMIFSTSCWHRDPHSIPWMEYLHQGPIKIWYGVPENQDRKFREKSATLHPIACQNKSLWLPSDISMIPPTMLRQDGVKVYRVEQKPGEFVLVMPRAYSCSICTGYTVSESTYFATYRWLFNLMSVFAEIRDSCEPTMFAMEQLLKSIAEDPRTDIDILMKIQPTVDYVFQQEINNREFLTTKGIKLRMIDDPVGPKKSGKGKRAKKTTPIWNVRDLDECEMCRCTLYLSKVKNLPMQNSMVCLTHALLLLTKKKYAHVKMSDLEMLCTYSDADLRDTMSYISKRLEPPRSKTNSGKK